MGTPDLDRRLSPLIEFEIGMLLGAPLFDRYARVTLDYQRRELTLEPAAP